jgi:hypothetical protein
MMKITLVAKQLAYLPIEEIINAARDAGSNKQSKGIDACTHLVSMIFLSFERCRLSA